MAEDGGAISTDLSGASEAVNKSHWDDVMYDAASNLYDYMAEDLKVDEDPQVMSETVDMLVEANVRKAWQIKHTPQEKSDRIFEGDGADQHRTLIGYVRTLAQETVTVKPPTPQTDASTMMAKAVSMLAQEQRKSRKRKHGRESSSSEDENSQRFDLTKSMEQYGLEGIPHDHRPRMKVARAMVKKLSKKFGEGECDLLSENVLEFTPQWMKTPAQDFKPKHFGGTMTHPEWVAAWWSRALVQLMAQGHAQKSTVTVQTLLLEFLNANQVAAQEHMDAGWEYDRHLWKNTSERIAAKDKKLDVKEAMTDASEKRITEVQRQMKSASFQKGPKGPKGNGYAGDMGGKGRGKGYERSQGGRQKGGYQGGYNKGMYGKKAAAPSKGNGGQSRGGY